MSSLVSRFGSPKGLAGRARVNAQILRMNLYLRFNVADDGHGDCMQVGRGKITDMEWCGRFASYLRCDDDHKDIVFGDVNYSGKDVVVHQHRWCKDKQCPICFLNGWLNATALGIAGKLLAVEAKGYGNFEHATVSLDKSEWGKPQAEQDRLILDALKRRGILGGALVYHGRRLDRGTELLKFAPHKHCFIFVGGGYDVCRNCEFFVEAKRGNWCRKTEFCNGFEQRTRRCYMGYTTDEGVKVEGDKVIVRMFGKRKAGLTEQERILRSSRYVLSHASYYDYSLRLDKKGEKLVKPKFYMVSYFGICCNSVTKSLELEPERSCPVCKSVGVENVMVKVRKVTKGFIESDIGSLEYRKVFPYEKFDASGLPNFVDWGGGSDGG